MNNNYESKAEHEPAKEIEQELLARLPELAQKIISDHPQDRDFKKNPDSLTDHEPAWHQFGIVTHSAKVCEAHQGEARELLEQWGVAEKVDAVLSEEIDGRTKAELFQISLPLHDLGKFASRVVRRGKSKKRVHTGHEAKSEQIIRENEQVQNLLQQHGLTEKQINYIATCVGLHYELGKMRGEAKKSKFGYSIAFAESKKCERSCKEIARENPEFQTEIGLYYSADSLAKTNIRIEAQTDEEIKAQTAKAQQLVDEQSPNPRLAAAVTQLPVNTAVAKKYLESIE